MSKATISAKRTSEKDAKKMFSELAKQTTPEGSIEELIQRLRLFEKKFNMSSVEFYRKFRVFSSSRLIGYKSIFSEIMFDYTGNLCYNIDTKISQVG